MFRIFKLYRKYLNKYPFIFQSVQTGILVGTGNFIAQTIVQKKTWVTYDFQRTVRFITIGTLFVGPVQTKWFAFLEKLVGNQKYAPMKKVVLDQVFMAPTINGGIIASLELLEFHTIEDAKNRVKSELKDILITNYKVWPFAQLVNFYLVPVNYQTLIVQLLGMIWNTYISWKLSKNEIEK